MRLTELEEQRLLVFTAAELARRHRAVGLPLNAPEAIALICDAMFEAARAGSSFEAIESAGRGAVGPTEVMPGVRTLVDEVRLEVLMDDGTRLVVLSDPIGRRDLPAESDGPGAIRRSSAARADEADGAPTRDTIDLDVRSASTRAIRVSSHYPFDRVNPRLEFDRSVAAGFRLDLPAGSSLRWAPGEIRTVTLVRFAGERPDKADR